MYKLHVIYAAGGMGLGHRRAAPVILTSLMGLALGVVWEFMERIDTILNPNTVHSYTDTMGDIATGGLGSILACLALMWMLSAEEPSIKTDVRAAPSEVGSPAAEGPFTDFKPALSSDAGLGRITEELPGPVRGSQWY